MADDNFLMKLLPPTALQGMATAGKSVGNIAKGAAANALDLGGLPFFMTGAARTWWNGDDDPRGFLERLGQPKPDTQAAFELGVANEISESADHIVGVDRKALSSAEQTMSIALSALLGGPNLASAAAPALTRLAASAPKTAKVLSGAARVVEVITPYTTPYKAKNILLNAAAGAGIDQGLKAYINSEAPAPEDTEPMPEDMKLILDQAGIAYDKPQPQQLQPEQQTSTNNSMPAMSREHEIVLKNAVDPHEESDWDWIDKALLGLGAAAAGAVLMRQRFATRNFGRGSTVSIGNNYTPTFPIKEPSTLEMVGKSLHADADAPMVNQIGKTASEISGEKHNAVDWKGVASTPRRAADEFYNLLRAKTRFGAASSTAFSLRTGKFAEYTDLRMPSTVELQERFSVLQKVEQDTLQKGIQAADEMDNRLLARSAIGTRMQTNQAIVPPQGIVGADATATMPKIEAAMSDAELTHMMGEMNANPKLFAMRQEYKQITDTMTTYMHREGLIDAATATQLRQTRPDFMPRKSAKDVPSTVGQRLRMSVRAMTTPHKIEDQVMREAETMIGNARKLGAGQGALHVLNPLESVEGYVTRIMAYSKRNSVQRSFIDYVSRGPNGKKDVRQLVTDQELTHKSGDTVVSIQRNGKLEHYEFADPMVATALRLQPYTASAWLAVPRRVFQAGTTGLLEPMFAIGKSLYWDSQVAGSKLVQGRSLGLTDAAFKIAGSNIRLGKIADPTAFFRAVGGIGEDAYAQATDALSLAIVRELENFSPALSKMVQGPAATTVGAIKGMGGEQWMRGLADSMRNQYLKSTRAALQEFGTYNTGYLMDPGEGIASLISKQTGGFSSRDVPYVGEVWRGYRGLMEAVNSGVRVAYYSQNVKPGMTRQQLKKLAAEARDLTGDFSRKGDGAVYGKVADALPYANVTVQAMRAYGRAFMRDPKGMFIGATTAAAIPAIGGAYLMSTMSPELRDWYWNRLPSWVRATHVPIPMFGATTPDEIMMLPLAPELSGVAQLAIAGADYAFGFSDGRIAGDESTDLKEALAQILGFAAPPLLKAGVAAAGMRIETQNLLKTGEPIGKPLSTTRTEGIGAGENAYIDTDLPAMALEIITAIGGTAARTAAIGWGASEQSFEEDGSVGNAVRAFGNYELDHVKQKMVVGPVLDRARKLAGQKPLFSTRVEYGGSEISVEYQRKADILNQLSKQAQIEFQGIAGEMPSINSVHDRTYRAPAVVGTQKDSILVDEMREFWKTNPVLHDLMQERSQILNAIIGTRSVLNPAGRGVTFDQLRAKINMLRIKQQRTEREALAEIRIFETNNGIKLEEYLEMIKATMKRPDSDAALMGGKPIQDNR